MLIELSYPLSPDIPVFPGSPVDSFSPHTRLNRGNESNTTIIHHYLHNGTHVDAPFHFYDKGMTIDQVPVEKFLCERPLIIERKLSKGELVEPADLLDYGSAVHEADLLIFCTGFYNLRGNAAIYANDFPALSPQAAKLIRTELLNVKAVAIDTLSIESCVLGPKNNFPVHKSLLDGDLFPQRPVLVFEDVNPAPILGKVVERIYAFPLRLVGLDGSPVTMVAEVK